RSRPARVLQPGLMRFDVEYSSRILFSVTVGIDERRLHRRSYRSNSSEATFSAGTLMIINCTRRLRAYPSSLSGKPSTGSLTPTWRNWLFSRTRLRESAYFCMDFRTFSARPSDSACNRSTVLAIVYDPSDSLYFRSGLFLIVSRIVFVSFGSNFFPFRLPFL